MGASQKRWRTDWGRRLLTCLHTTSATQESETRRWSTWNKQEMTHRPNMLTPLRSGRIERHSLDGREADLIWIEHGCRKSWALFSCHSVATVKLSDCSTMHRA